jgi:hypothetical protein
LGESTSIRETVIKLLERYQGLIGILDVEIDYGQLFWFMSEEKGVKTKNAATKKQLICFADNQSLSLVQSAAWIFP